MTASSPVSRHLASLALLALTAAHAQDAPLANPSQAEFRQWLSAPTLAPVARSFTRTAPPSTDGACAGNDRAPTPGGTRNLGVVPYGGAGVPSVNLAVQFSTGSDTVAPASQQMLDRLAAVLKEPELARKRFAVAGHTDATGDHKINLELSCARAIAVRQYLLKRGVAAERLGAYGFGSSKPLEEGAADSAVNRRVEIRRAD